MAPVRKLEPPVFERKHSRFLWSRSEKRLQMLSLDDGSLGAAIILSGTIRRKGGKCLQLWHVITDCGILLS